MGAKGRQPTHHLLNVAQIAHFKWTVRVTRRKYDHRAGHIRLRKRAAIAAKRAKHGMLDRNVVAHRAGLKRGRERMIIVNKRVLMNETRPPAKHQWQYHAVLGCSE